MLKIVLNKLHLSIMADNIKWDACTPAQRWVNTIILGAIIWFLLTSTSPLFAAAGSALFMYLVFSRLWYCVVLLLWRICPPPEEEKEDDKEKAEHYLLEKKIEKGE